MNGKSLNRISTTILLVNLLAGCSLFTPSQPPTAGPTQTPEPPSPVTECRAIIDGIDNLKVDLDLPDHLRIENPTRLEGDFDPNQYFQVLSHLQMKPGYVLDFVYFADGLGGMPLVYARPADSPPFATYPDFLQSLSEQPSGERSFSPLSHGSDYLQSGRVRSQERTNLSWGN